MRGPRNGERFPFYWRLDLSAERRFEVGGASIKPYVNIINVFNRKNVFLYTLETNQDPPLVKGAFAVPVPAVVRHEDGMVSARRRLTAVVMASRAALAALGCEIAGTTAPAVEPRVVVHAVLNITGQVQTIIVERTLRSRRSAPVARSRISRSPTRAS